jgi:site-specific DNA-methyltransferase (adenine-specific)
LIKRCILASTKEGDLVFDPFGGSFTTAKVARELGRQFISCDINDKYVEIGKKRINDLIHKLNC